MEEESQQPSAPQEPQPHKPSEPEPPQSPKPKPSKGDRLFRYAQVVSSCATVVLIILLIMSFMSPTNPTSPAFWTATPPGECWVWLILASLSGFALVCSAIMFCAAHLLPSTRARTRTVTLMLSLVCDLYLAYFAFMTVVALGSVLMGDAASGSSAW